MDMSLCWRACYAIESVTGFEYPERENVTDLSIETLQHASIICPPDRDIRGYTGLLYTSPGLR
jgi:hypothetical protein